jgi:hypothetical protein
MAVIVATTKTAAAVAGGGNGCGRVFWVLEEEGGGRGSPENCKSHLAISSGSEAL